MVTQIKPKYYTPEEYLELEATADYKNEYRDGEIIPMTGGTTNHNKIAGNFYAYLKFAFKGQKYDVYIGDVRLWISDFRQYTYPDVMVIDGEPIYEGNSKTTVTNPSLIVEVLSKSTQNYDQGDKFRFYRSIPQLQEYILLAQDRCYIMQYTKTPEGNWLLREHEQEAAILQLQSLEFSIEIKELYEGVQFEETEGNNE
ncbi:Uma2 family endonuclease [Crocosphaera sp. XPORK-15E]|uniref:Uma2 family endonuclease n=1 Tax=Crocosphaera sp. XPORK-15E TaxID=3110247 RepID=UPI002B2180AF|nr:Uma2 family endonuclease [Crocosphaera sp. XPORK-15E]MEA5533748.1 Uma2 family endonuclease [Crocosphaera sp. XPORK-15E]